jgi:hypothetical protein
MQIVGQVVMRVTQLKQTDCRGPVGYETCLRDRNENDIIGTVNSTDSKNKTFSQVFKYSYGPFNYSKTQNSNLFGVYDDAYFLYF